MKNTEREELDEYFKTGLTSPEVSEVDEDWIRMKVILQKNKRSRKLINSFLAASSVAAVLLTVFTLWPGEEEIPQVAGDNIRKSSSSSGTGNVPSPEISRDRVGEPEIEVSDSPDIRKGSGQSSVQSPALLIVNEVAGHEVIYTGEDTEQPAAETKWISAMENDPAEPVVLTGNLPFKSDTVPTIPRRDEEPKIPAFSASRFSLAFVLSPDFSGVNSLRKAGVGYGVGAGIIYRLSDKLDIETGLSYGVKIYDTDFSNYKPNSSYIFPVMPYEVNADCRVIDLQFNMIYRLLDKSDYSLGIKAGISSYSMLHENYRFKYEHRYARGPVRYELSNANRHYPGVANFALSYRRKLSDQVSLTFDPYLKLPLTDIGYGNVRLKSAGINIGVITNLTNSGK